MVRYATCMGLVAAALAISFSGASADVQNPALKLALEGSDNIFDDQRESVADTHASLLPEADAGRIEGVVRLSDARPTSFDPLREAPVLTEGPQLRNIEYAFTAPGSATGLNVDLAFAPRAGVAVGPEGGRVQSAGAEVRLGQRLEGLVEAHAASSWDRPSWYFFAATDGQALTWAPELQAAGANQGLRFQEERVVVGDAQLGVSVEANGLQASLSFTNREIQTGRRSRDENFLGAAITMRR